MAKLTKTQINAIVDKVRRDFELPGADGPSTNEKENAQRDFLKVIFAESNLPEVLKTFYIKGLDWDIDNLTEDEDLAPGLVELGVPYVVVNAVSVYDQNRERDAKFTNLLEDFRFELTMAGTDDYSEYMESFTAKLAEVFPS